MKPLTDEKKRQMLDAIANLGPEHWDEVKADMARLDREQAAYIKATTPSREQLQQSYDI